MDTQCSSRPPSSLSLHIWLGIMGIGMPKLFLLTCGIGVRYFKRELRPEKEIENEMSPDYHPHETPEKLNLIARGV